MSNFSNQTINETHIDASNILILILFACFSVSALFFTIVVITALYLSQQLFASFNMYLLNTSLADISVVVFVMPAALTEELGIYWVANGHHCSWHGLSSVVCPSGAIYSVALLGIDRLWSLAKPISHRNHRSPKLTAIVCISTCILDCFYAAIYGEESKNR